ncbi:MAG: alpha-galactosidase, partial [Propionibacterium sp.]|nr:alpha-galactosidase [Propionibacterium sp.]
MTDTPALLLLRKGGTSVALEIPETGLPAIIYWGADLGAAIDGFGDDFVTSQVPFVAGSVLDLPPSLSLIPQQSEGWSGTPGLVGSRNNRPFFPQFVTHSVSIQNTDADGFACEVDCLAHDAESDVEVKLHLELSDSGLLRVRAELTNTGADGYALESLLMALPTPAAESQVIDQTGHHLRERDIQTHEFTIGTHVRTLRVGRGHTLSSIHGTCEPAAGWRAGLTHYLHVAWSGNVQTLAERDTLGFQALMGGELLMPGEIVLDSGQSYQTPWLVATWGDGLDQASGRIHDWLRSRPSHPASPRPVTLNAWEAVYFDHSLPRLLALAEQAAEVGVERFVLDDGWFGSRRDDHSGLGDWVVSDDVWPAGLSVLADAVHARGMQFGLWFEPEMISPDSDAARAHPEWILRPRTHLPIEARHQQVIDLTNPEAYEYVRGQICAVLADTGIDYIKWDFNRDMYEAISPKSGLPVYHNQVLATYALMDALLEAHPGLEIESCAGGGGRIDLEMMHRAV